MGDQSSLTAEGALNVSVGDHTQLTGGIIHSDSNELTLETESLGHEDLQDHQDLLHLGAGGTIRPDDPESAIGNTHTAEFGLTDIQQTTHATLGLGDITIHDDLANGTNSLAGINRDIAQAQVITRHREIETIRAIYTEVNIGNLVNQVGEAGDRYRALMQDIKLDVIDAKLRIADILKGDLKTDVDRAMFNALRNDIDAGIITEEEAIGIANSLLSYSEYATTCNGSASMRWNPLYLLASPVYADFPCLSFDEYMQQARPGDLIEAHSRYGQYYAEFCRDVEIAQADPAALGVVVDFIPIAGDIKGGYETFQCDSGKCVAIGIVAGVVGIIPFIGDGAGKWLKRFGKGGVRNLDDLAKQADKLGIPKDWKKMPSRDGNGWKYVDPSNDHNSVRVMMAKPNSRWPSQRQPYVVRQTPGGRVDVNGNIAPTQSVESHISLENFNFKP